MPGSPTAEKASTTVAQLSQAKLPVRMSHSCVAMTIAVLRWAEEHQKALL